MLLFYVKLNLMLYMMLDNIYYLNEKTLATFVISCYPENTKKI